MQIKFKVTQQKCDNLVFLFEMKQICTNYTDMKQMITTFSYGCANWQHSNSFIFAIRCLIIRWITFTETHLLIAFICIMETNFVT
jgi:hypothetical protein